MKNIHVLPTDKPSLLYLNIKSSQLCRSYSVTSQGGSVSNRHIYITSDEKIKKRDYVICDNKLYKIIVTGVLYNDDFTLQTDIEGVFLNPKYCRKIILTTDQDLIKDGVQKLSDEFLECFVNNPSCEFVEVLFACRGLDGNTHIGEYRIIIPKEELHSMDDEVECNMCGGYMYLLPDNSIYVCTNSECTRCYEEPQQETIEEAIRNNGYHDQSSDAIWREGVHFGSKWQQEQDKNKYSEEEVEEKLLDVVLVNPLHITILRNGYGEFPDTYELTQEGVNHIVKQFKK